MPDDAADPAQIPPDTKDWTWVLERRCPDCGADVGALSLDQIPSAVRTQLEVWPVVLRRTEVAERPAPQTWSTLEYGAHVRDVLEVFIERLELLLTEDDPQFEDWDSDAAAAAGRYHEQDPAQVAEEIAERGRTLAAAVEAVPPEAAARPGRRSNGSVFTVTTLLQYLLHDLVHHAWDVTEGRPSRGDAPSTAEQTDDTSAEHPPPPTFARRHRRVIGIALAGLAFALSAAYLFWTPPQTDGDGLQAQVVRWSVPGCWALIGAASLCWAFDVRQKIATGMAYAALAAWVVYLGARVL
ncbi:DinB family protein [Ruania alba]|uniref:DinB superfamily protein n=1 Tax=Ruania alba TaxID=648782 RepID=A0A1H5NJK2_9MICO|nr:DinB superfamily protein [Ruania alba]